MITYGYDDGGCFFCGSGDPIDGSGVHPSERGDLAEMCRRMCDSDHGCVAYTIGRGATREGQEHKYDGRMANCCLERRFYPPGAYVDGSGNDARGKSNCQLDAACWTRYERGGVRGGGGVEVPSSSSSSSSSSSNAASSRKARCKGRSSSSSSPRWTPPPSSFCVRVWEPVEYADEDILEKLRFVEGGCDHGKDEAYAAMLARAHDQCAAEIFAESMTVSIVVRPTGTLTYVRVFADNWS